MISNFIWVEYGLTAIILEIQDLKWGRVSWLEGRVSIVKDIYLPLFTTIFPLGGCKAFDLFSVKAKWAGLTS